MADHTVTVETWEDAGIDLHGRRSGNVKAACPECAREKRRPGDRSFSANVEGGIGHCFRCGYVVRLTSAVRRGVTPERVYQKPDLPPADTRVLRPKGRAWLEARGIDPLVAEGAGVYSNAEDTALAFPFRKDGDEVFCKYRTISGPKRFWSTKDSEQPFYGIDRVRGAEMLVICEGEMDALAFRTADVDMVVSLPGGAVQPGQRADGKLTCLESAEDVLRQARIVVLATDGDEPGEATAQELSRRIGPEKCWRVTYPAGCKDANDVLLAHGRDAVIDLVDQARPVPVEGIFSGYDIEDELLDLYERGPEPGWTVGDPALDAAYTVLPGYMTIVIGFPGHGKSTWLDRHMVQLARRHDVRFALFSPEQMPIKWHQTTLIEQYTGKPFHAGPTPRLTRDEVVAANRWVADHFRFFAPEEPTVDAILRLARLEVYRSGINGIVIDPWNELDHSDRGNLSETEHVSRVLGKIRQFAQNHGLHAWVVQHPTKMPRATEGDEAVPTLENANGSAAFRNKADFGLTVWRVIGDANNRVDVLVTKSRRRDVATAGARVQFTFNPINGRFQEVGAVRTP